MAGGEQVTDEHPLSPKLGGPAAGEGMPAVGILDWYIPRLMENRQHDLSQSGFIYPWNQDELLTRLDEGELIGFWQTANDPREWIADRYGVESENVGIGHGVCQTLTFALLAAMPDPDSILHEKGRRKSRRIGVEMPSFGPVTQCARLLGCDVVPFHRGPSEPGDCGPWKFDREQLEEVLDDVSVIILTPMQNPSGWMLDEDDQRWIVDKAAEYGVNIVSDEVYLDSAMGDEIYRPFFEMGEHCLSVNSITKTYGLGNLRFGWVIGPPELIVAAMNAYRNLQGLMAAPSAAIAGAAWRDLDAVLDALRSKRQSNLPKLCEVLARHGIEWTPPPTGIFGLIPLPNDWPAVQALALHGKHRGLLAIPGGMFDACLDSYLRIAWGGDDAGFPAAMEAFDEFLTALEENQPPDNS